RNRQVGEGDRPAAGERPLSVPGAGRSKQVAVEVSKIDVEGGRMPRLELRQAAVDEERGGRAGGQVDRVIRSSARHEGHCVQAAVSQAAAGAEEVIAGGGAYLCRGYGHRVL